MTREEAVSRAASLQAELNELCHKWRIPRKIVDWEWQKHKINDGQSFTVNEGWKGWLSPREWAFRYSHSPIHSVSSLEQAKREIIEYYVKEEAVILVEIE